VIFFRAEKGHLDFTDKQFVALRALWVSSMLGEMYCSRVLISVLNLRPRRRPGKRTPKLFMRRRGCRGVVRSVQVLLGCSMNSYFFSESSAAN